MAYLLRSLLTFLLLYGLVVFTADATYFRHDLSVPLITEIAIAMLLLQFLLAPLVIKWFMNIDWDAQLPARNQEFLKELCLRESLPIPRVGIIHGAMPNAFTFGRIQNDANIVVTTGLIEALTPEELNAVIAHEAGHIKHWDFLAMTAAAIAPLLLYQIYAFARRFKDSHPATWGAYAAYWVSKFLVLSLSRTREYWADDFAARATGNASDLSSALVKICYGMAKVEREYSWAQQYGDKQQKATGLRAALMAGKIGVMGISSPQASFILSGPSPESAGAMMRWDLENPWAKLYELASTHPLTALRIKALNKISAEQSRAALYPLPSPTHIRWAGFPLQLFLWGAPWAFGLALFMVRGVTHRGWISPHAGAPTLLFVALLASWLGRIAYRYSGTYESASIRALAEDTAPSEMKPRAVRIEGEIVGRGQPGAFWSPDLVVKDATGIVFMLDRQSIPLARLLFALDANKWIGQKITLEGWYRRGMKPYVELSKLTGEKGDSHTSYSRWLQMVAAVVVPIQAQQVCLQEMEIRITQMHHGRLPGILSTPALHPLLLKVAVKEDTHLQHIIRMH